MTEAILNKPAGTAPGDAAFSSNEVRLSLRSWGVALLLLVGLWCAVPVAWKRIEPFAPGPDYRLPFSLSDDYWMYDRYCGLASAEDRVLLVGDSVIWGHYVAAEETLSHYLNEALGGPRFANLGVDGVHPVAMAGLLEYYGKQIAGKDVILQCNLLWMSSPRHDLQTDKTFAFNHPDLVPQFYPWIPCYGESLSGRIGIVLDRNVPFLQWTNHLRLAYFHESDLPNWTMEHPYEDPLRAVTLKLPSANEPPSPKPIAQPWTKTAVAKFDGEWVELDGSLQWQFFRRAVTILRKRGNRVFVLVGPFNEHMLAGDSLRAYERRKLVVSQWLQREKVPHFVPPTLPSACYADASHPLANGYARLAKALLTSEPFRQFQGCKGSEETR
jgi:hypothetical protein